MWEVPTSPPRGECDLVVEACGECRPERVVRVGGKGEDEVDGVAGAAMGGSGVTAGCLSEVGMSASWRM
jgi:hypothetical protein